jgi:hypothetical protein
MTPPSQHAIDQLALSRYRNPFEAILAACEVQRKIAREQQMPARSKTVQLRTIEALK